MPRKNTRTARPSTVQLKPAFQRFVFVEIVRLGELANHVLEQRLRLVLAPHLRKVEIRIGKKIDFNLTQALVLLSIWKPESDHVFPISVACQLGMERSRVGHQIKLLMNFGWIRYCPGSEKKLDLVATKEGLAAAEQIESSMRFIESQLRKGIAKTFDQFRVGALEDIAEQLLKLSPPNPTRSKRPASKT